MPEKYGVETLKKIALSVANVLNVLSKVINKQGLWHLIALKDSVEFWATVDLRVALAELKDLSESEREVVEQSYKDALDLVNKDVQAKISGFVDLLEKLADLAEDAYAAGESLYENAMKLYAQVRALLGV